MHIFDLAMAGLMACSIQFNVIAGDERMCFYQCKDSTKEFARTNKEYQCPNRLYVERKPLPFKEQDWKNNRWTRDQVEDMKDD